MGIYYLFTLCSFPFRLRSIRKVGKEEHSQFGLTSLLFSTFFVALILKVGFDFYSIQQLDLEISSRSLSINRVISDLDGSYVADMEDFASLDIAELQHYLAPWETQYSIECSVHQAMLDGIDAIVLKRANALRESSEGIASSPVPSPITGVAHMQSQTRVLVHVNPNLGQSAQLVATAYDKNDIVIPSDSGNLSWARTLAPRNILCTLKPGVHLLELMCDRNQRKAILSIQSLDDLESDSKRVWEPEFPAALSEWAVVPFTGDDLGREEGLLGLRKTTRETGTNWYRTAVICEPVAMSEKEVRDE